MNTLEAFLKEVHDGYDRNQPWLIPATSYQRRGKKWEMSLLRRNQSGDGVRNAGIRDISISCERELIHSLYGVLSWKVPPGYYTPKNVNEGLLNKEIDSIIRENNRYIIGGDSPSRNSKPWERYGSQTLFLKNHMHYKNAAMVTRKTFMGTWDILDTATNELIELKTSWDGLPKEAPEQAIRQLAIYIMLTANINGGELIYLSGDLSTMNPEDPKTYAAFHITREEASVIFDELMERLDRSILKLRWDGSDLYPKYSTKWFYRLIKNLPECDNPKCCSAAEFFHDKYSVKEGWDFEEREL